MTGRFDDLTGMRFGYLTVESRAPDRPRGKNGKKRVMWNCLCDCGNHSVVDAAKLKSGKIKSCGCKRREFLSAEKLDDLVGKRFGRLIVVSRLGSHVKPSGGTDPKWKCICDCGTECVKTSQGLKKSGRSASCGCLKSEITSKIKTKDLTGMVFGSLTVIQRVENHKLDCGASNVRYLCRCSCGNFTYSDAGVLRNGNKKSCGCIKHSFGEACVEDELRKRDVEFKTEYTFPDLRSDKNRPLRFDFAIFNNGNLDFLIEYQGAQHYIVQKNPYFGQQQREITDEQKEEYCIAHGIPLYKIKYNQSVKDELNKILDTHVNSVPSV